SSLIFISLIYFYACQSKKQSGVYPEKISEIQEKKDSTIGVPAVIEPDLFLVKKEFTNKFLSGKNLDFFQSKSDNTKLFFIPYTDGSITTAILTKDNLSEYYKKLLISENLNIENRQLDPILIDQIKSLKGISINSSKTDISEILGVPNKKTREKNMDLWKWKFTMKERNDNKLNSYHLKPFVLNELNLEFDVSIYFKNDSVQTLIYEYQIP